MNHSMANNRSKCSYFIKQQNVKYNLIFESGLFMILKHNLCMGCMSEKLHDSACRICGYSENTPYLPSYLPPQTVLSERYIVGKLISYNGEGATYIGYDTVTEQKVTITEYMPDAISTRIKSDNSIEANVNQNALYKTYMSDFLELHKALMKSRGMTHLQTVLDIFQENNTAYVVFEFINGISLKTYLQQSAGELTWEQVKELFPPILTTLSLIHSAGIVHRGISPSTIMVTDKMRLKITGFSISATRTANSELASELFAGYAAPEQYSSTEWHGTFTDVYGISAVFYRILTGVMPPESIGRVSNDNLIEPALINRNVPANVSKVLISGLKLDPETRIRTITELVDKLFEKPKYVPIEPIKKSEVVIQAKEKPQKLTQEKIKKKNVERTKIIIFISSLVALVVLMIISLIIAQTNKGRGESSFEDESSFYSDSGSNDGNKSGQSIGGSQSNFSDSASLDSIDTLPSISVPNLSDRTYYDTVINFEDKLVFTPDFKYSDTVAKDMIFDQSIQAGEEVPIKTEIKIKVSLGPAKVVLPDYKDKSMDDYKKKLDEAKILFEVKKEKSNAVPSGNVLRTSKDDPNDPQAIVKVDIEKGEKIVVYVAENFVEVTTDPPPQSEQEIE